jgi:hypothetical protein
LLFCDPREIANLLIEHHNQPGFPQLIEQYKLRLDIEVLEAVYVRITKERYRDAEHAYKWLHVVDIINTHKTKDVHNGLEEQRLCIQIDTKRHWIVLLIWNLTIVYRRPFLLPTPQIPQKTNQ